MSTVYGNGWLTVAHRLSHRYTRAIIGARRLTDYPSLKAVLLTVTGEDGTLVTVEVQGEAALKELRDAVGKALRSK